MISMNNIYQINLVEVAVIISSWHLNLYVSPQQRWIVELICWIDDWNMISVNDKGLQEAYFTRLDICLRVSIFFLLLISIFILCLHLLNSTIHTTYNHRLMCEQLNVKTYLHTLWKWKYSERVSSSFFSFSWTF